MKKCENECSDVKSDCEYNDVQVENLFSEPQSVTDVVPVNVELNGQNN